MIKHLYFSSLLFSISWCSQSRIGRRWYRALSIRAVQYRLKWRFASIQISKYSFNILLDFLSVFKSSFSWNTIKVFLPFFEVIFIYSVVCRLIWLSTEWDCIRTDLQTFVPFRKSSSWKKQIFSQSCSYMLRHVSTTCKSSSWTKQTSKLPS